MAPWMHWERLQEIFIRAPCLSQGSFIAVLLYLKWG